MIIEVHFSRGLAYVWKKMSDSELYLEKAPESELPTLHDSTHIHISSMIFASMKSYWSKTDP